MVTPRLPVQGRFPDLEPASAGGHDLPDERYLRTLDPWVSLATAAQATSRILLGTSVSLPVESDPITLAKTIATLDHLSGGRIIAHADGGITTPLEDDIVGHATQLREAWQEAGRSGEPQIHVLAQQAPEQAAFDTWEAAGVGQVMWGLPALPAEEAEKFIIRRAEQIGLPGAR